MPLGDLIGRGPLTRPCGARVPGIALRIVIDVEEQAAAGEVDRGPLPEEARQRRPRHRLRIARANRAHAPAAVARSHGSGGQVLLVAIDLDPALVPAVLRQPGIVHEGARSDPVRETRLLDREGTAGESDVGGHAFEGFEADTQDVERLDDLDRDRPGGHRHALHPQFGAGVDAVLHAVPHDVEMRVDNVEMRIDAQGNREKAPPIGRVAVEEIAVVEIAVGAREGHRFRRLVDRIVVSAAQDH